MKVPKEFVYSKMGQIPAEAEHVPFAESMSPKQHREWMAFHRVHPDKVEGFHDKSNGKVKVNTSAKDANGNPPTEADRNATYSHENIHAKVHELSQTAGKRNGHPPEAIKWGLNEKLIGAMGAPIAQHIGAYYLANLEAEHDPSTGKFVDPHENEIKNEIPSHLASIATPGSAHNKGFTRFMQKRDPNFDMNQIPEAYNKMVEHGANLEMKLKPLEPSKSPEPLKPSNELDKHFAKLPPDMASRLKAKMNGEGKPIVVKRPTPPKMAKSITPEYVEYNELGQWQLRNK